MSGMDGPRVGRGQRQGDEGETQGEEELHAGRLER